MLIALGPAQKGKEDGLTEESVAVLLERISNVLSHVQRIERQLERAESERIAWQQKHEGNQEADEKAMDARMSSQERWRAQWLAVLALASIAFGSGAAWVSLVFGR
jgi:hypothetical protein